MQPGSVGGRILRAFRLQVANWFVNARKRVWKPMRLASDDQDGDVSPSPSPSAATFPSTPRCVASAGVPAAPYATDLLSTPFSTNIRVPATPFAAQVPVTPYAAQVPPTVTPFSATQEIESPQHVRHLDQTPAARVGVIAAWSPFRH